jgi:dATP pyrophosphohydrolase
MDKIPISVLVVIHTPDLRVLLLERADGPGLWQSVTGSLDPGETLLAQAADPGTEGGNRPGCGAFPASPIGSFSTSSKSSSAGAHRYAPGVTHNTEHVFSLSAARCRAGGTLAPQGASELTSGCPGGRRRTSVFPGATRRRSGVWPGHDGGRGQKSPGVRPSAVPDSQRPCHDPGGDARPRPPCADRLGELVQAGAAGHHVVQHGDTLAGQIQVAAGTRRADCGGGPSDPGRPGAGCRGCAGSLAANQGMPRMRGASRRAISTALVEAPFRQPHASCRGMGRIRSTRGLLVGARENSARLAANQSVTVQGAGVLAMAHQGIQGKAIGMDGDGAVEGGGMLQAMRRRPPRRGMGRAHWGQTVVGAGAGGRRRKPAHSMLAGHPRAA